MPNPWTRYTGRSDSFLASDSGAIWQISRITLSRLDAGLWIRVAYTSVGAVDVSVKLNLFSHIPKE